MFPFHATEVVFVSGTALTETKELEAGHVRGAATVQLRAIYTAHSGLVDIKGRLHPDDSWTNLFYVVMADGALTPSNDQISNTTVTGTVDYVVLNPMPYMEVVMTRSAGSLAMYARYFMEPLTLALASSIGGPGAASIAKAEDVAAASGDVGVPAFGVQTATPVDAAAEGDWAWLQISGGRLWVDASGKTLTVAAHAVTNAGTFAVQNTPVTRGYSAAVSVTRTNDTNAYAANDVIGAATGSTAALTFASMGPSAGRIMITSVQLEIDITAVISGMTNFLLFLYNITPPSAYGDNAAHDIGSGDRASFLGSIDLGTPVDCVSTLYIERNGVNKQLLLAGTSLFGYLVTVGAYTPAASSVFTVTLHALAV